MNLSELRLETFEPLVGQQFTATMPDGKQFVVKLASVGKLMERIRSTRLKRQPFSLYFEGTPEFFLTQHIYKFTHPEVGDMDIFIVPIAREDGTYWYEAVFT